MDPANDSKQAIARDFARRLGPSPRLAIYLGPWVPAEAPVPFSRLLHAWAFSVEVVGGKLKCKSPEEARAFMLRTDCDFSGAFVRIESSDGEIMQQAAFLECFKTAPSRMLQGDRLCLDPFDISAVVPVVVPFDEREEDQREQSPTDTKNLIARRGAAEAAKARLLENFLAMLGELHEEGAITEEELLKEMAERSEYELASIERYVSKSERRLRSKISAKFWGDE